MGIHYLSRYSRKRTFWDSILPNIRKSTLCITIKVDQKSHHFHQKSEINDLDKMRQCT